MKSNIILFLILTFLIGFSYFFEEVSQPVTESSKKEYSDLFHVENISKIHFNKATLSVQDSLWKVDELDYRADENVIKNILYIFNHIKILKKISYSENNIADFFKYQKHAFSFKSKDKIEYLLGDVSEVTGNFYIMKKGKIDELFLCEDTSLIKGIYKNEKEGKLGQYLKIKKIILASPRLFIDKSLMAHFKLTNLVSLKIDNARNRWFEAFISDNKTNPQAPKDIKYKNIKNVLLNKLVGLKIKGIRSEGQSILSGLKSTMEFNLVDGSKIKTQKIKLYGALNGEIGRFAKISDLNEIFEIEEIGSSFFYANVQQFWDKKIAWDKNLKKLKTIPFELGRDDFKFYQFTITDVTKFSVLKDSRISKVNKNKINFIFNVLFNLLQFHQAQFVETLNKNEYGKVLKDDGLYIRLLGFKFKMIAKDSVIELVNLDSKTQYTYLYNSEKLGKNILDDVFTVKDK